jgi:hypothetical protein
MKEKENVITYKHGALAAKHIQFFGILLFIIGLVVFLKMVILSIFLMLIGLLIVLSNSGLKLDFEKSTFQEYNSFLFLKTGEKEHFNKIDLLYINKINISQQMNSPTMAQTHTTKYVQFAAYIKFDNGEKIHVLTEKDKVKLVLKLEPIVNKTGISITDNTLDN